jgi:RNA polymerase sigma-70 factor (ECF subfamily)
MCAASGPVHRAFADFPGRVMDSPTGRDSGRVMKNSATDAAKRAAAIEGGLGVDDEPKEAGDEELMGRAAGGDRPALAELFGRHRGRLDKMVRSRLHRALQGRVDPADVLQEVYLDLEQQLPHYPGPRAMPPFLWLRLLTGQRLTRLHRHHLGAAMRAAGREVAIPGGDQTEADSALMADQLVGRLTTASRVVARAERARLVREAIDALDPADREIIALRGFEGLTNGEAATVLGLSKAVASNRYVRAMARLQAALQRVPGLLDPAGG